MKLNWQRIHLIIGILFFVIFLVTGAYMRSQNPAENWEMSTRALYRAEHLYLLLISLINVSLGNHLTVVQHKLGYKAQVLGSIFLLLSLFMMITSFIIELPATTLNRPICVFALYFTLAGVVLHSLANLLDKRRKAPAS